MAALALASFVALSSPDDPARAARVPSPGAPSPVSPAVVVAWGGDCMFGRGVAEGMARTGADPLEGLRAILASADATVVNLEGLLTSAPRTSGGGYDLRGAPQSAALLGAAGVDLVTLANNHSTDNGPDGLAETRSVTLSAGVLSVGGGPDGAVAAAPALLRSGGIDIAVLTFDATGLGIPAGAASPGVARYEAESAAAAVARARRRADVVLASVHWGIEYDTAPRERQRDIAGVLVAAGADAVIGHHPHVLQPVEWLPRSGRRPAFVAWSIGNMLFDALDPDPQSGAVLETLVDRRGVVGFRATPLHTDWLGARALDDETSRTAMLRRLMPVPELWRERSRSPAERWWVPNLPAGGTAPDAILRAGPPWPWIPR